MSEGYYSFSSEQSRVLILFAAAAAALMKSRPLTILARPREKPSRRVPELCVTLPNDADKYARFEFSIGAGRRQDARLVRRTRRGSISDDNSAERID